MAERIVFEEDLNDGSQTSVLQEAASPNAIRFEEDEDTAPGVSGPGLTERLKGLLPSDLNLETVSQVSDQLLQLNPLAQTIKYAPGVGKAVAATLPDIASIPLAAVTGGMVAGAAALDADEHTKPGEAFIHGMEDFAGLFYEHVTEPLLELGPLGDEVAKETYQKFGEGFDWALSSFGQGVADYGGRHVVKPVLEIFGHEWQPEDEAFWYATGKGTLAAVAMAYPFKGALSRMVNRPTEAPLQAAAISREQLLSDALKEATDETVQQGIAQHLWKVAAEDPNVGDIYYVNFDNPVPVESTYRQYQRRLADVEGAEAEVKRAKGKKKKNRAEEHLKETQKALKEWSPEQQREVAVPEEGPQSDLAHVPLLSKQWFYNHGIPDDWYTSETALRLGMRDQPGKKGDTRFVQQADGTVLEQPVFREKPGLGSEAFERLYRDYETEHFAINVKVAQQLAGEQTGALAWAEKMAREQVDTEQMLKDSMDARHTAALKTSIREAAERRKAYESGILEPELSPEMRRAVYNGEAAMGAHSATFQEQSLTAALTKLNTETLAGELSTEQFQALQGFFGRTGIPVEYGSYMTHLGAIYDSQMRTGRSGGVKPRGQHVRTSYVPEAAHNRPLVQTRPNLEARPGSYGAKRLSDPDPILQSTLGRSPEAVLKGEQTSSVMRTVEEVRASLTNYDKIALLQEFYGMEKVGYHPKYGIIRSQHELTSLGEQIVERYGKEIALETVEGAVGPTGRFYSPTDAALMKMVLEDVIGLDHLFAFISEIAPGPVLDQTMPLVRAEGLSDPFRIEVGAVPSASQRFSVAKFGVIADRLKFMERDPWSHTLTRQTKIPQREQRHRTWNDIRTLQDAGLQDKTLKKKPFSDYPETLDVLDEKTRGRPQKVQWVKTDQNKHEVSGLFEQPDATAVWTPKEAFADLKAALERDRWTPQTKIKRLAAQRKRRAQYLHDTYGRPDPYKDVDKFNEWARRTAEEQIYKELPIGKQTDPQGNPLPPLEVMTADSPFAAYEAWQEITKWQKLNDLQANLSAGNAWYMDLAEWADIGGWKNVREMLTKATDKELAAYSDYLGIEQSKQKSRTELQRALMSKRAELGVAFKELKGYLSQLSVEELAARVDELGMDSRQEWNRHTRINEIETYQRRNLTQPQAAIVPKETVPYEQSQATARALVTEQTDPYGAPRPAGLKPEAEYRWQMRSLFDENGNLPDNAWNSFDALMAKANEARYWDVAEAQAENNSILRKEPSRLPPSDSPEQLQRIYDKQRRDVRKKWGPRSVETAEDLIAKGQRKTPQNKAAAIKELTRELDSYAQVRQVLRNKLQGKRAQLTRLTNQEVLRRETLEPAQRYMEDIRLKGDVPEPIRRARQREIDAITAESLVVQERKPRVMRDTQTGKRLEGKPESMTMRWMREDKRRLTAEILGQEGAVGTRAGLAEQVVTKGQQRSARKMHGRLMKQGEREQFFQENEALEAAGEEPQTWTEFQKGRPISSRTARGRQRGAVDAGVFAEGLYKALAAVAKTFKRFVASGETLYEAPPGSRTFRRGEGSRTKYRRWKEAFLGSQAKTQLVKLLEDAQQAGVEAKELSKLVMDFDILPKWVYRAKYGARESFYSLRAKLRGTLITGSQKEGSLANALQEHGAQYFTGVRNNLPEFLNGLYGGLTKAQNTGLVRSLVGVDPHTPLSKAVKKVLDGAWALMSEAGVPMAAYVNKYFPYQLRRGIGEAKLLDLTDLIYNDGRAAGRNLKYRQVKESVFGMAGEEGWLRAPLRVRDDGSRPLHNAHMERMRSMLDVVDPEKLLPYLETDAPHVLAKYLRDASDRIAYATKFGAKDEKIVRRIELANEELNAAGLGLNQSDMNLITDMLNIVQRTYSTPWAEGWTSMQRVGVAWANWSKLMMVVPGSAVEALIPLRNRTFAGAWGLALAETVGTHPVRALGRQIYRAKPSQKDGFGTLGYDEIVGEIIGKVVDVANLDQLTATHAADLGSKVSNAAFVANGLHLMTNVLQTALIKTFRRVMDKAIMREAEIVTGRRKRTAAHDEDILMLKYYGIDATNAIRWMKEGSRHDSKYMQSEFGPALINYLQDNVMTARGVNQPRWHANQNLMWLRHLKTYVTMFGNTVAPDMVHAMSGRMFQESPNHIGLRGKNVAATMGSAAAMAYIAFASESVMDWWKYGGTENHPLHERLDGSDEQNAQWMALRAMNRWGLAGFGPAMVYDIMESGVYSGRGYPDEDSVTDIMQGTYGKDAIKLMALIAMGIHGATSEDGEMPYAEDVAKYMVSIMPTATGWPRNDMSPAEALLPTKEDFVEQLTYMLQEMGMD